jgi:hypothetical protein
MFRHAVIVFLAMLGLSPRMATAEEVIKSFDAAIQLEASGELDVTETITVHAMGDRIRHGIYRDFPFSWSEGDQAAFRIVSVERDGRPDDWSRQAVSGGTRIYIGAKSQVVQPGDHTYRIRYHTDTQVRFHDTYDNLVWNVTGNGWLFPIENATATVSLPGDAKPEDATVYTGPRGARGKDATAQLSGTAASFAMTRGLSVGEGLTIDIKIPKGVISPPKPVHRSAFEWWDEKTAIAGGSVLAIALVALFSMWVLYGKDPSKGAAPLRWTPPEGLSPGLIGYIQDNGFPKGDYAAFSASLIALAANGYLDIRKVDNETHITRNNKPAQNDLPYDQRTILMSINSINGHLEITKNNRDIVQWIINSYHETIKLIDKDKYFLKNSEIMAFAAFLLVSSIVFSLMISRQSIFLPLLLSFYIPISGAIPTIILLILTIAEKFFSLNSYLFDKIWRYFAYFYIATMTATALWLIAGGKRSEVTTELFLVTGFIPVASILVFLMGRTTKRGRIIKDQIYGLRKYLSLSANHRATITDLPIMSQSHFENLLPYAIVLGVEGPWLRTFEEWQDTTSNKGAVGDVPKWWRDTSFSLIERGFGGAIHHAISTSVPSSSSFGSGFTGSGGGGGGGGGW